MEVQDPRVRSQTLREVSEDADITEEGERGERGSTIKIYFFLNWNSIVYMHVDKY